MGITLRAMTLVLAMGVGAGGFDSAVIADDAGEGFDRNRFATIDLPTDALDVAIDTETSQLAVVRIDNNALSVYSLENWGPGQSPQPTDIGVGGTPLSVTVKTLGDQNLFLVGVDAPPSLVAIDARTLKVVRQQLLQTPAPHDVLSSQNPDDPFLYATSFIERAERITRFDLRRWLPSGILPLGMSPITLSHDGRKVYAVSSYQIARACMQPHTWPDVDPARPTTEVELIGEGATEVSMEPVIADPLGRFVACGQSLFDPILKEKFATAEFKPVAFLKGTTLMSGVAGSFWMLGSINDGRTLERVEFPESWLDVPKLEVPRPQDVQRKPIPLLNVLSDAPRQQFVLATHRHIAAFPTSAFSLEQEPSLWSETELPRSWPINTEMRLPIELSAGIEVQIEKAPEGMTVKSQIIHWTPTVKQIGTHELALRVNSGNVSRSQSWTIEITRPTIAAPFVPTKLFITPDGKHALLMGKTTPRFQKAPVHRRIAVLDLGTDKVICERTFPETFFDAVMSGPHVYVTFPKSLEQLDATTLETQATIPIENMPGGLLTLVHNQQLDLHAEPDQYGRVQRLRLPGLEPIPEFPHDVNKAESWPSGRCGYGWLEAGVLWDHDYQTPKLLLWPTVFRRYGHGSSNVYTPRQSVKHFLTRESWYPYVSEPMLKKSIRVPQGSPSSTRFNTPDYPANLLIIRGEQTYRLQAYDFHTAEPLVGLDLRADNSVTETSPLTRRNGYVVFKHHVATGGNECLIVLRQQVYHVRLSELGERPQPFFVDPVQSTLVLSTTEPNQVKYTAPGARKFYLDTKSFDNSEPLFKLISTSGEFTLELNDDFVKKNAVALAYLLANLGPGREANNPTRLAYYRKTADAEFVRLVGRPPKGVPTVFPVYVTAEGPKLESAVLLHHYLIEISEEQVLAALDEKYPQAKGGEVAPME